ncbi:5425_t:CDS:2 [Dentiscutata erythropus]|uniref:5425_t:CDS:1 n=1 Tax=Dentiscutata erythropus TaxID=1348616 RepID=A0A9N9ILA5_9GLOM|nr:5425_t:CDS:2 [Dentiscutata erythropus]
MFADSDKIIETILIPTSLQYTQEIYMSKSLNPISKQLQDLISTGILSLNIDSIPKSDEDLPDNDGISPI